MKIETVIEKAIEAGWTAKTISHDETCENIATHGDILLDPLFWQALGKSMRWGDEKKWIKDEGKLQDWKFFWHDFIDHLADGGTIESFFAKL